MKTEYQYFLIHQDEVKKLFISQRNACLLNEIFLLLRKKSSQKKFLDAN